MPRGDRTTGAGQDDVDSVNFNGDVSLAADNNVTVNSVDSITGENSGDNLGPGTPTMHFDQWENDEVLRTAIAADLFPG